MFKRLVKASLLWPSLLCTALIFGGCHHEPPEPDGGTIDLATLPDLWQPPSDMACNPIDPDCKPADMKAPSDMKGAGDMSGNPDMTGMGDMSSPVDMTGMGDMSSPVDMTGMGDMSSPVDMTGMGDMSGPTDMRGPGDMSGPTDMRGPGDMSGPTDMRGPGDMSSPGDMTSGGANIGDPCTADTDCKVGSMPTCWKANVLNNPANPATTGGYCSAKCTADTDCGSAGKCIGIGAGKYCLKACGDATTCRHPGYACAFVGGGVCYPDSIYDCDPKSSGGTCTEVATGKSGGCLRQAFEDKGNCAASCNVGAGSCADLPMGVKRQCIYYDTSLDGFTDAYKGLICVGSEAMPKMVGADCSFLNDCVDGAECDGVDGKCHSMCVKGGTPACATGSMCQDDFTSGTGGPGLCR